jgi:opacity protein-like surface antigen
MKHAKAFLALAVVLGLAMAPALIAADAPAKGEWTGYITDGHCGEKGANKDHTADCVEKCMKAGTKAQIWIDADKKGINLDSFEKVKSLVGSKVTVKGTLDAKTNTIQVESAAKAAN